MGNNEPPGFIAAEDLRVGDVLFIGEGKETVVTRKVLERAPPGETFTTYNFEVKDFHTYFVGNAGVWVHNAEKTDCERVFDVWQHFKDKGDANWDAYLRVSKSLPNATTDILKKTIKEVSKLHKTQTPSWNAISLPRPRLQHTFDRHKTHWGFDAAENWGASNEAVITQRIQSHINDPLTDLVEGCYRGKPATFYINTDTGLAVVKDAVGDLTAGVKFSSQQVYYLLKKLSVN